MIASIREIFTHIFLSPSRIMLLFFMLFFIGHTDCMDNYSYYYQKRMRELNLENERGLKKLAPHMSVLLDFKNKIEHTIVTKKLLIELYLQARQIHNFLDIPTKEQETIYFNNLELMMSMNELRHCQDRFFSIFLWLGVDWRRCRYIENCCLKRPHPKLINAALYLKTPNYTFSLLSQRDSKKFNERIWKKIGGGFEDQSFLQRIHKLFPEKITNGIDKEKFISVMQPKYICIARDEKEEKHKYKKFNHKDLAFICQGGKTTDRDLRCFYGIYEERKKAVLMDLEKNFNPETHPWVTDFRNFFEKQCMEWETSK